MSSEATPAEVPLRPKRNFLPLLLGGVAIGAILASFIYSWQKERAAVQALDRQAGQFCVDTAISQHHWRHDFRTTNPELGMLFDQLASDFATREFEAEIVTLDTVPEESPLKTATGEERAVLERLETRMRAQLDAAKVASEELVEAFPETRPSLGRVASAGSQQPVFEDFYEEVAGQKYYVYYQPVYFKEGCASCHTPLGRIGGAAAAGRGGPTRLELPFRVVRVRMPVSE